MFVDNALVERKYMTFNLLLFFFSRLRELFHVFVDLLTRSLSVPQRMLKHANDKNENKMKYSFEIQKEN